MPQMYFIAEAFPSILETVCTTPLHLPLLFLYRQLFICLPQHYCNAVAISLQLLCNIGSEYIVHICRADIISPFYKPLKINHIQQLYYLSFKEDLNESIVIRSSSPL